MADPQYGNFVVSKFVLPLVIFSQHAMQCTYPSSVLSGPGERKRYILWRLIPVTIMSLAFACTWLVPSPYEHSYRPDPKAPKYTAYDGSQTLHWGGDFTHQEITQSYICRLFSSPACMYAGSTFTWLLIQYGACAHSGLVAYDFYRLMPATESNVGLVHNFILGCVVSTLLITEGTMQLGSKWCTYCMIYSVVYIADPLWFKEYSTAPVICSTRKGIEPTGELETAGSASAASPADNGYRGTGSQLRYRGGAVAS